jgi:hypothetical protein
MTHRRQFLKVAGASLVCATARGEQRLRAGSWRAVVSATGEIVSLRSASTELVDGRLGDSHLRVSVAGQLPFQCNRPTTSRRDGDALIFEYRHEGLTVEHEIRLAALPNGACAIVEKISLSAAPKLRADVTIEVPRNIHLPFEARQAFVPLRTGVGRSTPVSSADYLFQLAGMHHAAAPEILSVPVVDEFAAKTDLRIAFASDPWFTSCFRLPSSHAPGSFHCTYLGQVGLDTRETRTLVTALHRGAFNDAMSVFYQTCLSEVRPGPEWIHDVAMVDYDYLSDGGKGWFSDIDTLAARIQPADRGQVLLALHGWYDYVGRYTFNARAGSLDKTWKAFPNSRAPEVQALAKRPDPGLQWGIGWHPRTLDNMVPVEMSWTDMHRRIRYAKSRGFRVALYFADGVLACDGLPGIFDPSKVLRWGGWSGPDTKGKSYSQNPLHPDVRAFYKAYMHALLAEVGKEVDAFIWDETFYVLGGDLGTAAAPGYADRAMMHLVREVASEVAAASPQLAFFTSDNLRPFKTDRQIPTALAAHGTYQDSSSLPQYWPCGLFTNFRNTLWSCNWYDITGFALTRYAVETFDTPVAVSDGYGDNIPFAGREPRVLQQFFDLFEQRKQRRMRLHWVDENNTYRGKPLRTRRELMPA